MESISKILECPICFQKMSAPKLLPCQHTFCMECTKKVATTKKQVQCALCQRKHKLPVNGVMGLPNNSILEDLFQLTYSNHIIFEKEQRKLLPKMIKKDNNRIRLIKKDPIGALIQNCEFLTK